MADRGSYHHGDLRESLLDGALGLLDAEGLEGVSLRAVSRTIGVSHSAPYHHFSDKAGLVDAMTRRISRELGLLLAGAAQNSVEHLPRVGITYVCWAVENPHRFRLLNRRRPGGGTPIPGVTSEASGAYAFDVLLDSMIAGQESGQLAEGDPNDLAMAAWSAVHGLATLLLDGLLTEGPPTVVDAERLATTLTEVVGFGLLRR